MAKKEQCLDSRLLAAVVFVGGPGSITWDDSGAEVPEEEGTMDLELDNFKATVVFIYQDWTGQGLDLSIDQAVQRVQTRAGRALAGHDDGRSPGEQLQAMVPAAVDQLTPDLRGLLRYCLSRHPVQLIERPCLGECRQLYVEGKLVEDGRERKKGPDKAGYRPMVLFSAVRRVWARARSFLAKEQLRLMDLPCIACGAGRGTEEVVRRQDTSAWGGHLKRGGCISAGGCEEGL